MDLLVTLLVSLCAAAALLYAAIPFSFWRRIRLPVPTLLDEVDLSAVTEGPALEARAYLDARERDLRALGFAPLGTFSLVMVEGQRAFTRVFGHAETGDGASALVSILEKGRRAPRVTSRATSFVTRLADGPELVTTDSAAAPLFTTPAKRRTVQVPEAPDAASLRRIHVGVAHAMGWSKRPRAERLPRTIEALARACREALDAAILAGELVHDGRAGAAYLTLGAAYRIMWGRFLPPGRGRHARRRRAEAEEALREAGERM